jgi:NAD(P)-dependent dehydrogenase (short-subunit alcohol dehydrogenase family)
LVEVSTDGGAMTEPATILITGATDGLGKGVATELARRGATVLVHGRDRSRLDDTVDEIGQATGNERVRGYLADLSSLAAVRGLAEEVLAAEPRLDVLINNAGIGRGPTGAQHRETSTDGHELRLAVNYLAPFLLTQLLLPRLQQSEPARIVDVASIGQAPLDFDDVMLERSYEGGRAYSQSKLALIMFSFELAARLDAAGAHSVTVNCLHPGTLMPTKIVHESWAQTIDSLEHGIDAVVRLAVAPQQAGVSGRDFDGQVESKAHDQAYDPAARRQLWSLSEELVARPA